MNTHKKIIIYVASLTLIIVLLGIATLLFLLKPWDQNIPKSAAPILPEGVLSQGNVELEKLTAYNGKIFFFHCPRWMADPAFSSQINSLSLMNDCYPIEHIENIDENNICVVYRFFYEEYESTYAFVFFKKDENSVWNEWHRTGEVYFSSKLLSSKDYFQLQNGITAEEVMKIDNGVCYDHFFLGYMFKGDDWTQEIFATYRPLTDGVMILYFEKSDNDVSNDNVFTDFSLYKTEFFPYGDENMPSSISLTDADVFQCLK